MVPGIAQRPSRGIDICVRIGTPLQQEFDNVALVGAVTVESDVLRARLDEGDVAGCIGSTPDDFTLVTVGIDEKDRPAQQPRRLVNSLRVGGIACG